MTVTKKIFDKNNKILSATAHVAWIMIISLTIIFLMNELFQGSNLGKIVMLVLISLYIIFSFARKFWMERKTKKILDAIDITLTLVGGLFSIIVSFRCDYCSNIGYAIGGAPGSTVSQPHILIFYLGVLLLIMGAIRVYMINKQHSIRK